MTLALLTRGYICVGGVEPGPVICGPGPGIASIESITPDIDGSATEETLTPTIVGVGVQGPQISGAAGPEEEPTGDTPTISGGEILKPEGAGE
jgi:hypothetical protein